MPEYIEREAVKRKIKNSDMSNREKIAALLVVSDAPAADVEPVVHGRWMYWHSQDKMDSKIYCSECKEECEDDYNFCPSCGAHMKGGDGNGKA